MSKVLNIYAELLEDSAREQFNSAMLQEFVVSGSLMPDAHTGYSLPIGAVVATRGVVVPAWVGYDIGCGMCALKLDDVDPEDIKKHSEEIFDLIYERIPVSFNINKTEIDYPLTGLTDQGKKIAHSKKFASALGSLGGGNHFIEIGLDTENNVWIIIHSGSRGVGHAIATHYMTLASSNRSILEAKFDEEHKRVLKHNPNRYEGIKNNWVNKRISRARPKEGHYNFSVESQSGKDYLQDLNWCLDFALANRKEMLYRVMGCIGDAFKKEVNTDLTKIINRNHNHIVERDGLWIHRKGATHAEEGMMGVIPGNMHDGSFIVKGKGNPLSLWSSSHGAGRVMGRKQAKRELNFNTFRESMENIKALITEDTLDEAPKAYKDIYEVMLLQKDLVEIITHVKPLINIKG